MALQDCLDLSEPLDPRAGRVRLVLQGPQGLTVEQELQDHRGHQDRLDLLVQPELVDQLE